MKGFPAKLKLEIPQKWIKYHSLHDILPLFSVMSSWQMSSTYGHLDEVSGTTNDHIATYSQLILPNL